MSNGPAVTPLIESHRACKGRIVEFAGYDLPVQYEGVIAESEAVRQSAGMFDVSHMARLHLRGAKVLEFLEQVTTNDVAELTDGTGQYSLLPNLTGGIVDDIIVYRITADHFRMVVNAANHAKDVAWLNAQNTFGVEIEDETSRTAMIAVQGPKAADILMTLSDKPSEMAAAGMFGVVMTKIAGIDCFAARSGYTGEDGFELIMDAPNANELWGALLKAGVVPCGLGSRDVLRVEAGLPLYGHELSDERSPIEAGLGWVISKTKRFNGSEIINAAREAGTQLKLQGVRLDVKRVPPIGANVLVGGMVVGQIASGVYSPMLGAGIGFAFLDNSVKLNTPCLVEIRGKQEIGTVVSKRFFKRAKSE